MAAQRPKRNNSPVTAKLQPLKATAPLSSLVRNPSPTRRRTSPSSPNLPPDVRNRLRRSPDVSHGDHRALVSPLGSKADKPKTVINKGESIRRTSSLEALSSAYANSYINGQWPRDSGTAAVPQLPSTSHQQLPVNWQLPTFPQPTCLTIVSSYLINKFTQTPSHWDDGSEEQVHNAVSHKRSSSSGNADSKEKIRQCLQRTKHSHSIYEKQSPVHADHSTFLQYYPTSITYKPSRPVDIPPRVPLSPKGASLHTRKSVEGLNIELEGLDLESKDDAVFARTPPEGRRPPVPGDVATLPDQARNVDTHTQTANGWIDNKISVATGDQRSLSTSPSWPVPAQHRSPSKEASLSGRSLSADSAVSERESPDAAANPKFAPSPKPNNTYMFARDPPDGAEKVPLNVEDVESAKSSSYSCPDTSKCAIKFSADSPFYSLPSQPKVVIQPGYS